MRKIHSLRKPVESGHALARRQKMLVLGFVLALGIAAALALLFIGCGETVSPPNPPVPPAPAPALSALHVRNIAQAAAGAADPATMVIAVTDRAGVVFAVFRRAEATATGNFGATVDVNDLAGALPRTARHLKPPRAYARIRL